MIKRNKYSSILPFLTGPKKFFFCGYNLLYLVDIQAKYMLRIARRRVPVLIRIHILFFPAFSSSAVCSKPVHLLEAMSSFIRTASPPPKQNKKNFCASAINYPLIKEYFRRPSIFRILNLPMLYYPFKKGYF